VENKRRGETIFKTGVEKVVKNILHIRDWSLRLAAVLSSKNSWFCSSDDPPALSPSNNTSTGLAENGSINHPIFSVSPTLRVISKMKFATIASALFIASASAFAPPAFVNNKNVVKSSTEMQMA
jgi:hypothetical protein